MVIPNIKIWGDKLAIVEFFGMPRAGKTILLQKIEKYFLEQNKTCDIIRRPYVKFNEVGGLEAFHQLYIEYIEKAIDEHRKKGTPHLFFDRGPYDRRVFLSLDMDEGLISREFNNVQSSRIEDIIKQIDSVYMMIINQQESFNRWPAQTNEGLDNQHLNIGLPSYDIDLMKMSKNYNKYNSLITSHPEIIVVDGNQKKEEVFSKVLYSLMDRGIA